MYGSRSVNSARRSTLLKVCYGDLKGESRLGSMHKSYFTLRCASSAKCKSQVYLSTNSSWFMMLSSLRKRNSLYLCKP